MTGCPRGQVMDVLTQMCRDPGANRCDELPGEARTVCLGASYPAIDCPAGKELRDGRCVDPANDYCTSEAGRNDFHCEPERWDICTQAFDDGCGAPRPSEPAPMPPEE